MKRKIKIDITNFWKNFRDKELHDDYLFKLLSRKYDLEIVDDPDLLIFSVFPDERKNHTDYECLKIFYTGENVKPDHTICDHAFSFEETDDKNFQLPNFVRHPFFKNFVANSTVQKLPSLGILRKINFVILFTQMEEQKKEWSSARNLILIRR